ncbi:thioredoxin family protein [Bacillus sp. 2205SS5-2]|uniref:thioredoxin family protein n=1 Tax=Bacillus sp. 2205SS5-2 TaxID=3109031 RepID=UPI003006717D
MNLIRWFEKGMSFADYKSSMNVHHENLQNIYESFRLPHMDIPFLKKLKNKNLKVIVLTEDWCGDAMLNIPILMKVAEEAGIESSFLQRDSHLELMDQYLTNGVSRAIPIFIFFNEAGKEKLVWGPRAPKVQKLVEDERAKLPPKEEESFMGKQKEMITNLTSAYIHDLDLREEVYNSLKTSLYHQFLV